MQQLTFCCRQLNPNGAWCSANKVSGQGKHDSLINKSRDTARGHNTASLQQRPSASNSGLMSVLCKNYDPSQTMPLPLQHKRGRVYVKSINKRCRTTDKLKRTRIHRTMMKKGRLHLNLKAIREDDDHTQFDDLFFTVAVGKLHLCQILHCQIKKKKKKKWPPGFKRANLGLGL